MLVDVDGTLRWASASDWRAQVLEDDQEVFAAGPCAEAFTTGRPAVMHDAPYRRSGTNGWLCRAGRGPERASVFP
jgi:hypothetical protein